MSCRKKTEHRLRKHSSPGIISHSVSQVSVAYKQAFHQIECLVRLYSAFIAPPPFFFDRPLVLLLLPIADYPCSLSLFFCLFEYQHLQAFHKCTFVLTTWGWCVNLHDKRWWLSVPSRPFREQRAWAVNGGSPWQGRTSREARKTVV